MIYVIIFYFFLVVRFSEQNYYGGTATLPCHECHGVIYTFFYILHFFILNIIVLL